jgi:proteasome assembly chaperone (PAC2) family protein
VLLGLAKQRNTPCFGLLGATPGTHPDLVAARNVLRALAGIYELPIGLDEIDQKIQDMESRVKKLQQFQAEVVPGTETPTAPPVPRGYIS